MEKNKSKLGTVLSICFFVVIFAGLLITATFTDLQISQKLVRLDEGQYFTTNLFGAIFASIGSCPTYIMLSAAFAIIYSNTLRSENKVLKILGSIAANAASVVAMVYIVFDIPRYLVKHFGEDIIFNQTYIKVVFIFAAAAIAELICRYFAKLDDKTAMALLKFSFIVIFAVILSNILINIIIKNVMCRPRYRTMWYLGDYEFTNFRRWYQKSVMPEAGNPLYFEAVNGIHVGHDAYRSFPSGHTNAAAAVYGLLVLPRVLKKYNTTAWKILLVLISVGITGVVAVSRIVCGAHFFSDVLVGGTIMFLCVMLGIKIFIRSGFERA
ncbi:MAG: phosphatase PAP2 family protein [Ruminococcaceae bacterium]|nr:phosphatase PAP2 family protein [Oscillospiraceae bacterium]